MVQLHVTSTSVVPLALGTDLDPVGALRAQDARALLSWNDVPDGGARRWSFRARTSARSGRDQVVRLVGRSCQGSRLFPSDARCSRTRDPQFLCSHRADVRRAGWKSSRRLHMSDPSSGGLLIFAGCVVAFVTFDRELRKSSAPRSWKARHGAASARPICPSCCRPLTEHRNFCRHCLTPLTGYAATGPIESILAEGELFRRSVSHPTRLGLIGLWLFVVPLALLLLGTLVFHQPVGGLVSSAAALALYAVIALKATRAFIAAHSEHERNRVSPSA